MDDKDFKKHLKDLAHGHHHPEEHDWAAGAGTGAAKAVKKVAAKSARKKTASKAAKRRRK